MTRLIASCTDVAAHSNRSLGGDSWFLPTEHAVRVGSNVDDGTPFRQFGSLAGIV
ncbi:hypothetical protein [Renibacterium salmoninarum]|uniref:hypothetical protein n=1 Tax=Renibacterium salmoninarum TaxID=1646 RepID=UPI0002FFFD53|nr:hypothetical protein [Renibacterium salmoninarum]